MTALDEMLAEAAEAAALRPDVLATEGQRALFVLNNACRLSGVPVDFRHLAKAAGVSLDRLREVARGEMPSATMLEAMASMLRFLWPDLDTTALGRRLVELTGATERHPLGGPHTTRHRARLADLGRLAVAARGREEPGIGHR